MQSTIADILFNNGWIVIFIFFCHWPPRASRRYPNGITGITNTDGHQIKISFRVIFSPSISLAACTYTHTILFAHLAQGVLYIKCTPRFGISLFMNRFRSRWPYISVNRLHRWEITGPFVNDDVRTCVDFSIFT